MEKSSPSIHQGQSATFPSCLSPQATDHAKLSSFVESNTSLRLSGRLPCPRDIISDQLPSHASPLAGLTSNSIHSSALILLHLIPLLPPFTRNAICSISQGNVPPILSTFTLDTNAELLSPRLSLLLTNLPAWSLRRHARVTSPLLINDNIRTQSNHVTSPTFQVHRRTNLEFQIPSPRLSHHGRAAIG